MLLSEREHSIFTMLFTKKFDLRFFFDELRKMQPEIEEVNRAAYEYVDNGYVAADTLALLLEHGGNPNLILNGESLLRDINFAISNLKNHCQYYFKIINDESIKDGAELCLFDKKTNMEAARY